MFVDWPGQMGWPQLQSLDLSYNRLVGSLPLQLGHAFGSLQALWLSSNALTGLLPNGAVTPAALPSILQLHHTAITALSLLLSTGPAKAKHKLPCMNALM